MVANHILNFQPQIDFLTHWLVNSSSELQQLPHRHLPTWPRVTLFAIHDFISKFIEINGNPSLLYVTDCYRRHYDTQINEIIKITNKINPFILPRHHPLKNLHFTTPRPIPSILTHPFRSTLHRWVLTTTSYANTPPIQQIPLKDDYDDPSMLTSEGNFALTKSKLQSFDVKALDLSKRTFP